jgi:mRNA interferase MazF
MRPRKLVTAGRAYVPDRGDAVWLHFNPQTGHEQAGRRPALVISPRAYNEKVGLALFCPVTTQVKGYPFEVLSPARSKLKGAILSDQVKSLDWRARHAEFLCRVPEAVLQDVLAKIHALLA